MPSIISFNSFKGGAGRSTTCINVAAQIAGLGYKVLVIDLDTDGPGLGTLLDIKDEYIKEKGAITYFNAPAEAELSDHIIAVSPEGLNIDFMGAPLRIDESARLPTNVDFLSKRIENLRRQALSKYDYVIIDAASGISNMSALAFSISDTVALCFKWSRQHYTGAMLATKVLCMMLEAKVFPLKDFSLVANAVPRPVTRGEEQQVNDVKNGLRDILANRWGGQKTPRGLPIPAIQQVHEISEMKFWEQIVDTEDTSSAEYRALANYLISRLARK